MTTEPPPGSGGPPEDDPFRKRPPKEPQEPQQPPQGPPPSHGQGQGGGSPYDAPYDGEPPPPYSGGPYGGEPYGGHPADPLAGMPPLADSGKRTLARIIDMILVYIVVALLVWAFGVAQYTVDPDKVEFGKTFGREAVTAVLYVVYDTVLTARFGQTLGKRWLRMRVANLDDGATPSVQSSLVRALVLWVPFAFCCACLWTAVCGGWSYFDKPYKQGLHDKAAKTVVVSAV